MKPLLGGGVRYLVIGAAATGRAVTRYLSGKDTPSRIVDRSQDRLEEIVASSLVERIVGDDDLALLSGIDVVVPSPGVPRSHPILVAASNRGLRIWSEIEVAYRGLSCPIVAITGTNGKSTTTVLLGEILKSSGKKTFVGGNLGTPLVDACSIPNLDVAVAEVSSFQLEWLDAFRVRAALVLNLSPDHLDRYTGFDDYAEVKLGLLDRLDQEGVAILNRNDPRIWDARSRCKNSWIAFGRGYLGPGASVDEKRLVVTNAGGGTQRVALDNSPLQGTHNEENMMAAAAAASVLNVDWKHTVEALRKVRPLPHRLELVAEKNGVRFYDDSKGTNVGAVAKSMEGFASPVILLAGGRDKGGDFSTLRTIVEERAKQVICFGEAAEKISQEIGESVPRSLVADLSVALSQAVELAEPGDIVLLSPGCASFDQFSDYRERGRYFRERVEEIRNVTG